MMDEIIISNENHILHLNNQEDIVDFTIYDNKGHSLDGGQFDNNGYNKTKNDIIAFAHERFGFSEPYIRLTGAKAENLLELIEMEDYKNTQSKITALKKKSVNIDEMELTK